MYDFGSKKNNKWIAVVVIILAVTMVLTTMLSALMY